MFKVPHIKMVVTFDFQPLIAPETLLITEVADLKASIHQEHVTVPLHEQHYYTYYVYATTLYTRES